MPTECPSRGSLNSQGLNFHKTKGLEVKVILGVGSVIRNVNAAIPCNPLGYFPHGHKCCSMHPSPRQEEGESRKTSSSFEALSFCSEREVSPWWNSSCITLASLACPPLGQTVTKRILNPITHLDQFSFPP